MPYENYSPQSRVAIKGNQVVFSGRGVLDKSRFAKLNKFEFVWEVYK